MTKPFDHYAMEKALVDWVSTSTDIPVFWMYENVLLNKYPYAGLHVSSIMPVSSNPELEQDYDPDAPLTEEITRRYLTDQVLCLQLNVFSKDVRASSADRSGSPLQLVQRALSALSTSAVVQSLSDAGLAFQHSQRVKRLPQLTDARFVDRAYVECYFGMVAVSEETTTYVQKVQTFGEYLIGLDVVTVGPNDTEIT